MTRKTRPLLGSGEKTGSTSAAIALAPSIIGDKKTCSQLSLDIFMTSAAARPLEFIDRRL
jgi:hypothetical protein